MVVVARAAGEHRDAAVPVHVAAQECVVAVALERELRDVEGGVPQVVGLLVGGGAGRGLDAVAVSVVAVGGGGRAAAERLEPIREVVGERGRAGGALVPVRVVGVDGRAGLGELVERVVAVAGRPAGVECERDGGAAAAWRNR